MRRLLMIACLLGLVITKGFTQQKLLKYTAGNDMTYSIGQMLRLGQGSGSSGQFNAVYWGTMSLGEGRTKAEVGKYGLTIKEIVKGDGFGGSRVLFTMEQNSDGFTSTYTLDIEKAIDLCEIRPCRLDPARRPLPPPTPAGGRNPGKNELNDELIRAQVLLQDGEISRPEYETYKRFILSNGIPGRTPCQMIMRLADMHKNGILTGNEFEHMKNILLMGL